MTPIGIYLAGTIDGIAYAQATGWRINFTERLKSIFKDEVVIFDPTAKYVNAGYKPDDILDITNFNLKEAFDIFNDDIASIDKADIALVNILGDSKGIGTILEIGYMLATGANIIAHIDNNNPLKRHPFLIASCLMYNSMDEIFEAAIKSITLGMVQRKKDMERNMKMIERQGYKIAPPQGG